MMNDINMWSAKIASFYTKWPNSNGDIVKYLMNVGRGLMEEILLEEVVNGKGGAWTS